MKTMKSMIFVLAPLRLPVPPLLLFTVWFFIDFIDLKEGEVG